MNKKLRKLIIKSAYKAKHGHIPSALSIVELIVNINENLKKNDVFILSKGHGCLAYYSYLAQKGVITKEELFSFGKKGSRLGGHPDRNKLKEIYASTGSLGHGLPLAVGVALSYKISKRKGKVYCLIGDGEANEGSVWEAIMIANNLKLNNLVCVVDLNNSQIRSMPTTKLLSKFKAFGWEAFNIDGHLDNPVLFTKSQLKPLAIIANTIKGKGVKEIENNMFEWHHKAPDEEQYKNFIKNL